MDTQHVLLGLINTHPNITGYQLKNSIDATSGRMMHIHLSKIYPTLHKMTDEGLLTYKAVPSQGRLDQKFYRLTPKGRETLVAWMNEPFKFTQTRSCFNEYLLKLSSMAFMGAERICSYLDEGITWLEESLEYQQSTLANIHDSFEDCPDSNHADEYLKLWRHQREYLIYETENRISWLESLKREYEQPQE